MSDFGWNNYVCGICGGIATMGIMSLVARCMECGAKSVKYYPPKEWEMSCAEGAD